MTPFNKPYLTGKESQYMNEALKQGKLSGNGIFTKKCQSWFEDRYGFNKVLLTTSCTDALEMAALLIDTKAGDEVIAPSYTFVSTVNAFVLRGAKIVFADSRPDHPGIDEDAIEALITPKTKAIVVVHYAGIACDMDTIMAIAQKHNLFVIEDAAQAIDSYYTGADGIVRPLGSIGHLAAFSFHETKNIVAGEGGMLVINDAQFQNRAEMIWEKGTNRSAFFRGEVEQYNWMDIGSSFLPSELTAAFLYAQLESIESIQSKRKAIWNSYFQSLAELNFALPVLPDYSANNANTFFVVCENKAYRNELISYLKKHQIIAVFHYLSLHKSPYYLASNPLFHLPQADRYSECLVRLPLFFELEVEKVVECLLKFA
jgi:dTDP-4-amino-4,6-dideoxygalactose transaminase